MQFILVSVLLIVIAVTLKGYQRSNTIATEVSTSITDSSDVKKRKLSSADRPSGAEYQQRKHSMPADPQQTMKNHGLVAGSLETKRRVAQTEYNIRRSNDNRHNDGRNDDNESRDAKTGHDDGDDDDDDDVDVHDDAFSHSERKSSYLSLAANNQYVAVQHDIAAAGASTATATSPTGLAPSATPPTNPTNANNETSDKAEPANAATSSASSATKNLQLFQCFRKLEPITQNAVSTVRNYLNKISIEQQNCEELVFSLIVQHIQSKQIDYKDVDRAVSKICTNYMWPLLSYLVTVLAPNHTIIRRIAKNVIHYAQNQTEEETSPSQLDLLFVTMLLADSSTRSNNEQPSFQPTDVFVGRNRYLFDSSNQRSRSFSSSLKMMLADQHQLITAELRNRLDHRRAEYNVTLYMRYWQIVALEERHPAYAKVHPDHCIFIRNLCLQTHCTPIGAPYELLAMQTLIHLASRDPTWFNDQHNTQAKFVLWFEDQLIRAINPSRAFLPSFLVHLADWVDISDTSPLLSSTSISPTDDSLSSSPSSPPLSSSSSPSSPLPLASSSLSKPLSSYSLQYHEAVYNQMSLQVTFAHTAWKHMLTLNRPNAPLPVHFNSINSYAGRVYLSDGVTRMVMKLDNMFGGVLLPPTTTSSYASSSSSSPSSTSSSSSSSSVVNATTDVSHSQPEASRVVVFTMKLDQPMLERWTESEAHVAPFLKLRGVTSLDNRQGNLIVHLRTLGAVEPIRGQTRSYNAWLCHLLASYFTNTTAFSWRNFAALSPDNNEAIDLPMLRSQRYFRLACEVYAAALDRVKTNNMLAMHKHRVNRRKMRKLISNMEETNTVRRAVRALCIEVDERYWYDGSRYTYEEPIDFTSTYQPASLLEKPSERTVSAAEAYLWTALHDYTHLMSRRFKQAFAKTGMGSILRTRLSSMILLADVAIRVHSLEHFINDSVYRVPNSDAVNINTLDASIAKLRDLVAQELSIFERLNRPANEIVKSKKICEIPVNVILYERPLYQLDLLHEHNDTSEYEYENSVTNGDQVLLMSELRVTMDYAVAGKSVTHVDLLMSHSGKMFTLKPLQISPHVLMRDSFASIEKQFPQFNESVFSIADIPKQLLHDLDDTTTTTTSSKSTAKPLSIYIWFPRVASDAGRFDNLESCMVNPISLRVSSARQHNFKLINVLWEGTQYLVVKQESHTHCTDHEKSGLNLWYGLNTNPDVWSTGRFYGVTHTVALRPHNNRFYTLLQRNGKLPATSPQLYLTDKDEHGVEVSCNPRAPYTRQVFRSLLAIDPDETLPSLDLTKNNSVAPAN